MFYIFFITLWFAVCVFHYSISFSLPDSLLPCYLPHTLPHPTAVGNSAIYSNGWRPRCVLIDYLACPSRRSAVLLRLPPLLPLFTPFTPTPIQTQSEALASPGFRASGAANDWRPVLREFTRAEQVDCWLDCECQAVTSRLDYQLSDW